MRLSVFGGVAGVYKVEICLTEEVADVTLDRCYTVHLNVKERESEPADGSEVDPIPEPQPQLSFEERPTTEDKTLFETTPMTIDMLTDP